MRLREAVRRHRMLDTFGGYDWGDPIRLFVNLRPPLTWAELLAEVEWFRSAGVSPAVTAKELGIAIEAITRRCERHNRHDLASWLRTDRLIDFEVAA